MGMKTNNSGSKTRKRAIRSRTTKKELFTTAVVKDSTKKVLQEYYLKKQRELKIANLKKILEQHESLFGTYLGKTLGLTWKEHNDMILKLEQDIQNDSISRKDLCSENALVEYIFEKYMFDSDTNYAKTLISHIFDYWFINENDIDCLYKRVADGLIEYDGYITITPIYEITKEKSSSLDVFSLCSMFRALSEEKAKILIEKLRWNKTTDIQLIPVYASSYAMFGSSVRLFIDSILDEDDIVFSIKQSIEDDYGNIEYIPVWKEWLKSYGYTFIPDFTKISKRVGKEFLSRDGNHQFIKVEERPWAPDLLPEDRMANWSSNR